MPTLWRSSSDKPILVEIDQQAARTVTRGDKLSAGR